jgi:hypothetical protein
LGKGLVITAQHVVGSHPFELSVPQKATLGS